MKQKVFQSRYVSFFEDYNIEYIKKVVVVKNFAEVFEDYDQVVHHEYHDGWGEV